MYDIHVTYKAAQTAPAGQNGKQIVDHFVQRAGRHQTSADEIKDAFRLRLASGEVREIAHLSAGAARVYLGYGERIHSCVLEWIWRERLFCQTVQEDDISRRPLDGHTNHSLQFVLRMVLCHTDRPFYKFDPIITGVQDLKIKTGVHFWQKPIFFAQIRQNGTQRKPQ